MIFNKLQFDDIDSKDHGIYITGSAAFNSPSRDVEMVTVPGRNGDLILDNGRYNNIEVTYPAGTFGNTEEDFRDKICNFRNLLASKKGYQRLTDTYNPDEYRMAAFVDAIEVEPVGHNIAGEFDIVFNCKPQRFLTSGETEVTVANNGTITNPTLFDASPLIMTKGYGTLQFNGHKITIQNKTLGDVVLKEASPSIDSEDYDGVNVYEETINADALDSGDVITVKNLTYCFMPHITSAITVSVEQTSATNCTTSILKPMISLAQIYMQMGDLVFNKGTNATKTASATFSVSYTTSGSSTTKTGSITANLSVQYSNGTIFIGTPTITGTPFSIYSIDDWWERGEIVGTSTKYLLGDPTYIDCELGIVYKYENGTYVSLDRYVDLGARLPVLNPGTNTITYDNTFTDVKFVPRWWRL